MTTVLLVDDDEDILLINRLFLEHSRAYAVYTAVDGKGALEAARQHQPQCVVLDIGLPDISGLILCKELKKICPCTVIFLSCKSDAEDRVDGFEAGGDDYMIKPFSAKELEWRISKNAKTELSETICTSRLVIDTQSRQLFLDGELLTTTKKEFDLLYYLMCNKNKVCDVKDIFNIAWDIQFLDDASVVHVHVSNLRKKLAIKAPEISFIETIWGNGYRFNEI